MKKLILENNLVEYIDKLIYGVDNLHCSEEYRAGYVEALLEIQIAIPSLSLSSGIRRRKKQT